jgi:hypothetical protein
MHVKTFLTIFLLSSILAFILLTRLVFDAKPTVEWPESLEVEDARRIMSELSKHDPSRLKDGDVGDLTFTERDINLLLHYGLGRSAKTAGVRAQIALDSQSNSGLVRASYATPDNPFGAYINITARLSAANGNVSLDWMRLGLLPLPSFAAEMLMGKAHERLVQRSQEYNNVVEALQALKSVRLRDQSLLLTYEWNSALADSLQARGGGLAIPAQERTRFKAYSDLLPQITPLTQNGASVADLIQPFFDLARRRTEAGNDPIAENRAAIMTLALYIHNKYYDDLGSGRALGKSRPRPIRLVLAGRFDLAQHFLTSAGLSVAAGTEVADAIGLFKELDDSRGGSGFSFPDLTADRAGVVLAETATASVAQARAMQLRLSRISGEKDFMPAIGDLPEGLQDIQFKQRFGTTQSDAYDRVKNEIEKRLARCKVYKNL